jgi:hypothetical protein
MHFCSIHISSHCIEVYRIFFSFCVLLFTGSGKQRGGCSSEQILAAVTPHSSSCSEQFKALALQLLQGETLTRQEAQQLGTSLFNPQEPGTALQLDLLLTGTCMLVIAV